MTFIGIVIFTVYTKTQQWRGACDQKWSTPSTCADVIMRVDQVVMDKRPMYIGEFKTADDCHVATLSAEYPVTGDELVDDQPEVLCVPKGKP